MYWIGNEFAPFLTYVTTIHKDVRNSALARDLQQRRLDRVTLLVIVQLQHAVSGRQLGDLTLGLQ